MRKSLVFVVLVSLADTVAQAQMVTGFTVRSRAVMPVSSVATTVDTLLVNKFSAWEGGIESLTVGRQYGLGMTVFGLVEVWSNRGLRVHGPIASDWAVSGEESLASDGAKTIVLPDGWSKTPGAKYSVVVTAYRHRGEKDAPLNVERYPDYFVVWSAGSPCDFSYVVTLTISAAGR